MKNVFLVDDEPLVLEGFSRLIGKTFTDLQVSGTARSGREAIEKILLQRPQIILIDIKMPGMSGLDVIREVQKTYRDGLFILITAYERFDIARQAVDLGVYMYLTKPLKQDELLSALRQASDEWERRQTHHARPAKHEHDAQYATELLEEGFIGTLSRREVYATLLPQYREFLHLTEPSAFVICGDIRFPDTLEESERRAESLTVYTAASSAFRYKMKCCVGRISVCRFAAVVPLASDDRRTGRLEKTGEVLASIRESIRSLGSVSIALAAGRTLPLETLPQSFIEADRQLTDCGAWRLAEYRELDPQDAGERFHDLEQRFLERLQAGETDLCGDDFSSLIALLRTGYGYGENELQPVYRHYLSIGSFIARNAAGISMFRTGSPFPDSLFSAGSGLDSERSTRERIERLCEEISDNRKKNYSRITAQARAYLAERFTTAVSLEETADYIQVSPQHLSSVFQKETGQKFVDYLTQLRIQKAKQLLRERALSIKEICAAVGYGDPNYFSRLFKKVVGVTPSEFSSSLSL